MGWPEDNGDIETASGIQCKWKKLLQNFSHFPPFHFSATQFGLEAKNENSRITELKQYLCLSEITG